MYNKRVMPLIWITALGAFLCAANAETGTDALFNRNSSPVRNSDFLLLTEKGYRFDANGRLLAPKSGSPVFKEDYYYLIEDLRSRARLNALMEINLILGRNSYAQTLPQEDREALREIGRKNWSLLSKHTREQIAPHFDFREVGRLNENLDESAGPAPPNAPLSTFAGTLMPLSNRTVPPAVKEAPPKPEVPVEPVETPQPAASETKPADPSPPQLPTEDELDAQAPAKPEASAEPSVPAARPEERPFLPFKVEAAAAPPTASATMGSVLEQNVLKPSLPPPLPPPLPEPVPVPAPLEAPAAGQKEEPEQETPPAPVPQIPEFDAERFALFLKTAPYEPAIKSRLELLARHAQGSDLVNALGTLMLRPPRITEDGDRAGTGGRYELAPADASGRRGILLNSAPREISKRRLLRGRETYRLPENKGYYEALGIPVPELAAYAKTSFSEEQRAGTLLHALMALDAQQRGWSAASYQGKRHATDAEFRFYRNIQKELGRIIQLDRPRAALFDEWTRRPEGFSGFLAQAAAGGPRRSLQILEDSGAVAPEPARDAARRLPPPPDAPLLPPKEFAYFEPPSRRFSADIPTGWTTFEEKTPRSVSVHILGPEEAQGAWRAAYHVHFFEKSFQGHVGARQFLKDLRTREAPAAAEVTPLRSLRVSQRPARLFEVRESRMLPYDRLPAADVKLHHYCAFVPANKDDYALIQLSTTEETFLDYRAEYLRFLKSFRLTGY